MLQLKDIISKQMLLNTTPVIEGDPDIIIGGGGGGGAGSSGGTGGGTGSSGGTGGGQSGTTSAIVVPTLAISPSTAQSVAIGVTKCFTASATISIAGEANRYADFSPIIINGCVVYNPNTGYWRKNCGVNNLPDAETVVQTKIFKQQPFYIVGTNGEFNTPSPTPALNNTDALIGVKDSVGGFYYWRVFKYNNGSWFGQALYNNPSTGVVILFSTTVNFNENFRVRSDGINVYWDYQTGGIWGTRASKPIPTDSGDFQFFVNALWVQNTWTNVQTFKGSYQGAITPTWTTTCGTLTVTGNQACFTPLTLGTCRICADTPYSDEVCVDVTVEPLFLKPVGITCGTC